MLATESELRLHRCCFSGHRPEKRNQPERVIVAALEREIRAAVADAFVTFISGMARGVDVWAAEIVLRLKAEGLPFHLICASPFDGFERGWSAERQHRYAAVLAAADLVKYVCPSYSRACFQIRNEWMVDRSSRVFAIFNGETIDYANQNGIPVVIIE